MKKPIFSGKLYVQSLKKVRTLGIAVMIAVVLLNMFMPIMGIIDGIQTDRRIEEEIKYYEEHKDEYPENYFFDDDGYLYDAPREPQPVSDYEFAPFLWAMMGFAPLLVIAMFSFLNERKQSDFYHSLPQTRVCMYLSMTAAIFTWLLGVILVSVGVNALLWGIAKYYTFTFATVFSNIVFYFVLGLFMSGSLAVAMMITGTTTSNLLIYAFLMLFPRYLVLLFQSSLDYAIDILPNVMDFATLLSIERFLPLSWAQGDIFYNGNGLCYDSGMLIYSAVVGVLMFILAGVLYHFRRSESATKSAPNNLAQHIYRTAFVTAMAITIPFAIVMDGLNELVILLLMMVVIVHVLYELLTTKKIKKMVKSLPLIVIPLVLAGVFYATVAGAKAYVYSVRPDAEDVQSVTFSDINYDTYGEYQMQGVEFTDRNVVSLALQGLYNVLDDRDYPVYDEIGWYTITYELESGRKISRYVWMTDAEWKQICMMMPDVYLVLPNDDDITSFDIQPMPGSYIRYEYDMWTDDVVITDVYGKEKEVDPYTGKEYQYQDYYAMQKKIWNLFKEEYGALSKAEKLELLEHTQYNKRADSYYIEVRVNEYDENRLRDYTRYFYYQLLPEYTPKTIDFIMSLYGTEEQITDALLQMKENLGGNVTLYTLESGKYQRFYVDTEDFFKYVTLDAHLFADGGHDTLVIINGYELWLNLTKEELQNVLGQYGSVEIYDKYN